jgi:hypothetical protein
MSIRRLFKLMLLNIPPVRRYAEGKWRIAEALQESEAARARISGEVTRLLAAIDELAAERDRFRDEVDELEAAAEADYDAALEQTVTAQHELKAVSATRDAALLERDAALEQVLRAQHELKTVSAARDAALVEQDAALKQRGVAISRVKELENHVVIRERLARRDVEQDLTAVAERVRRHKVNGAVAEKDIVFCISPGRSGTRLLAVLLSGVLGVDAHHEPEPRATLWVRPTLENPIYGLDWLIREKLPAIAATPNRLYVETSHLLCKGLIEPMFMLGLHPRFIILRRDSRQVAKSYFMLNVIPGRNEEGYLILTNPADANSLKLPNWQDYSDYQLCYWYAKDMERRQTSYLNLFREKQVPHTDINIEDLIRWESFIKLCEFVHPERTKRDLSRQLFEEIISSNQNPRDMAHVGNIDREPPSDLVKQEREIDLACAAFDLSTALDLEF